MIAIRRGEQTYPARLNDLRRPPDPLWSSGQAIDWSRPAVAIVGTRRMSAYGARIAREVATVLARAGAIVVSGLAQGIDSEAHRATVDAGGCTVAVLGEGLAAFEASGPLRRRRLAERIRERGAVVSEYALDLTADRWTFPRRNWTIAALAETVVVVEAGHDSGALITARAAVALRRPVHAVPGPLGASTWVGANRLIADGRATLLADPGDLLGILGLAGGTSAERPTSLADRALELLAAGPVDLDQVATELGLHAAGVATLLAEMVILGLVTPTGDGRFARR